MPWRINNEFLYQVFALLLAVIVVHGVYIGLIRPTAEAQLAAQAALQAAGEAVEAPAHPGHCDSGFRTGGVLHLAVVGTGDHGPQGAPHAPGAAHAGTQPDGRPHGHQLAATGFP